MFQFDETVAAAGTESIQVVYVSWIHRFPTTENFVWVMIEVLYKLQKCENPPSTAKPFVTDFMKKLKNTVSIQATA